MIKLSRRSLLEGSLGLVAAGTFARPYIANAAAKTAKVWWVQGFVPQEDAAFKAAVADYEKKSGNKIDYTITPFAAHRQKIVAAITSGVVPDLIYANPPEYVPLQAWDDRLVDMTDVVETQKSKMLPIALQGAYAYNSVKKKRSYYGVPFQGAVVPFHIWGSLIEKAGFKVSDIPNKWDAFIDFFHPVQAALQKQGMRHTYAHGFVVSTIGNDPTNTMQQFIIAYGGENLVTKEGKFNGRDPQVTDAVVRAVDRLATLYKNKYIPPSSINWNDADDNNAFHSKLCVMDFDGTLSTELGMLRKQKAEIKEVVTRGLPLSNEGKTLPKQYTTYSMVIPKGAHNIEVAKDFAKYMFQPDVNNRFLKGGLGRWLPVFPELAKDPWWASEDPHRTPYVAEAFNGPIVPFYFAYNAGWAKVRSEHPFNVAFHDVTAGGMKPKDAVEKAMTRVEKIFANYHIGA